MFVHWTTGHPIRGLHHGTRNRSPARETVETKSWCRSIGKSFRIEISSSQDCVKGKKRNKCHIQFQMDMLGGIVKCIPYTSDTNRIPPLAVPLQSVAWLPPQTSFTKLRCCQHVRRHVDAIICCKMQLDGITHWKTQSIHVTM